jgi:ankyrin repeat protein
LSHIHCLFSHEDPPHTTNTTLLYLAAENGICGFISAAIARNENHNNNCGRDGYLLQAASAKNHEIVAKILLGSSVDPVAQGGYYGSALLAAILNGNVGIVRHLVKHGITLEAKLLSGPTALRAALENGHFEIAQRTSNFVID